MATGMIADSWVAIRAQFEDDDLDTVFRLRNQMPTRRTRLLRPIMMIIKWPYRAKVDGMPRQVDMKRMSAFEDELEVLVESPGLGIQVACLTGNGRRTWRYYVADPDRFSLVVRPLFDTHGPGPFLFKQVEDSEWEGLAELMPLLESGHHGG